MARVEAATTTPVGQPFAAPTRRRRTSSIGALWRFSALPLQAQLSRLAFFVLVATVLVVAAISLVNALRWVNRPFAGFLVNERMVPGNVGQYHWTGTAAGLKYLDKVLRANGAPVASMKDLERIVRAVPVGEPITYTIDRAGQISDVSIATMRFTWFDLIATFGIPFLSGIFYLAIGAIVYALKPDTRASWAFLLACFYLSIYTITAF